MIQVPDKRSRVPVSQVESIKRKRNTQVNCWRDTIRSPFPNRQFQATGCTYPIIRVPVSISGLGFGGGGKEGSRVPVRELLDGDGAGRRKCHVDSG